MSTLGSATAELEAGESDPGLQATGPTGAPAWRRLLRHPSAIFGILVLTVFLLAAVAGPILLPFDPGRNSLRDVLQGPSFRHLLGTDELGRDELRMLIHGARYTLLLGFLAVALGLAVGVPLGTLSGYVGGWFDLLVQRLTDILLAFPGILLGLILVATFGVSLNNVIFAVGISSMPGFIRLSRAEALRIRELTYIESARASGTPRWRILLRHVIPNGLAPIIVQATLQLGATILLASALGFFGLAVKPPTPEWGTMLGTARGFIFNDPMLATYPGLAIFFTVLAFNLLGDGLRDVLDPRLKNNR